jgi:hypothetical protein
MVRKEERAYIERQREVFLTLRSRESMEVVTVIEVLSPGNKRKGSDGREEYLRKRDTVLLSAAHLVEFDLLRGGERLPIREAMPPGDYYAFVCRQRHRPQAAVEPPPRHKSGACGGTLLDAVYAWSLRQPLPSVPVPLAGNDPDTVIDLQIVCGTVYDRAGYDYSLGYHRPVEPPLSEADAAWVKERLRTASE